MMEFTFRAPMLFEPLATPSDELRAKLRDALGVPEVLARSEKLARWLKDEMGKQGLDANGPFVDESGWVVEVPSGGGFVWCLVSGGSGGDEAPFHMLLAQIGDATEEVGHTVAAMLSHSSEITEFKSER